MQGKSVLKKFPKKYIGTTKADEVYQNLINSGLDSVTAAKQAQMTTGISLITGLPIKSKGYGWQSKLLT